MLSRKNIQGLPQFTSSNLGLILILVAILAFVWYPALSFWFFRAWEPTWLIGVCGKSFNIICLMRGHAFLYLLNYKIFGWNPWGWYLTAIILHVVTVLLTLRLGLYIFKNRHLAFIAALLFGVNVSYHDVINWGSFEGLYALLLSIFLIAVFIYKKYKEVNGEKKLFLYSSLVFLYAFALFLRESGLLLPLFLLIWELFDIKFRLDRKKLFYIIRVFFPFAVLSIFYLYLRKWYGGAPNDFIDAMVQYRITLLSQGNYSEYIKRGILSFGRLALAHPIPYPILNSVREFLATKLNSYLINFYFFSLAGLSYVFLMLAVIYNFFVKRIDKYKHTLIFSFLWFFIPTLFFSFAWTITDDALLKEYVWDASRWRYFAFLGTVFFWMSAFLGYYERLSKKRKQLFKRFGAFSIISVLLLNFYFLRLIQREMYSTSFDPAKNFYKTFLSNFKSIPEDYVFYHFPASILNDYLAEWYLLREVYYPNLKEVRRDWAENQMGMLLDRLNKKTANLSSIFFLDITKDGKLIDKTQEVKEILRNQKPYTYYLSELITPKGEGEDFILSLLPGLNVEVPYRFTITLAAYPREGLVDSSDLVSFAWERDRFIKSAKVEVCATAPAGSSGAPAMHLLPKNLTDGTIGGRSLWAANCRRPAWIIIDLGRLERVSALAFHGRKDSPGIPSDYKVLNSKDNNTWETVVVEDSNTGYQRIERFPQIKEARYIKLEIEETVRGGFPELDEILVISERGSKVIEKYGDDFENLVRDSYKVSPSVLFSWKTEPTDTEPHKYLFAPIVPDGVYRNYVFEPNESEVYSLPGEFLKRFIKSINLEFSESLAKIHIVSVKVEPKYQIYD